MSSKSDERPIAPDAWENLKPFREAGAQSFHNFSIENVRPRYIESSKANALSETRTLFQADYVIDDFQVRVYDPRPGFQKKSLTPAILFIHGGGWLMGNLETHHSAARRLSLETGLPVVSVDYRLAPEHPFPAAIDDCRTAFHWLANEKEAHGLDVESISVIGDSAGGQLAAVLANEFSGVDSLPPVSSQVLIYPITDITKKRTTEGASYQRVTEGFPLVADTMRWFIENYVSEADNREDPALSPLFATLPEEMPPTYILTVDNDPLADEGAEYALKLAQAGADVTYRHLAGYHHGLVTSAGVIPQGERALSEIAGFISSHAEVT